MGSELVGTTAAETKDPEKTLPRAINAVPVRIMVFYVGALVTILMVTPGASSAPIEPLRRHVHPGGPGHRRAHHQLRGDYQRNLLGELRYFLHSRMAFGLARDAAPRSW